jgi:2-alkyl-3-oxoalkanoate reductase
MEGADESAPYPERFDAAYPRTKALAEQLIVAANGKDLASVSIRPHLIWGPGDNNLLPRIISRARTGRLRRIGGGDPKIDPIYIDNAAMAHFLAADKLEPGCGIAGKVYFVTQGETIPLWTMIDRLLASAGIEPVRRSITRPLAIATAGLLELGYYLSRQRAEPPLTRFLVRQLSTTHWFKIDAARRDLGYEPKVSIDEGMRRLEQHLRLAPGA